MAVDVNYVARNISLNDQFREYAEDKFDKIEQLINGAQRLEVKVTQHKSHTGPSGDVTVELTLVDKSTVVRAESSADEKLVAFDRAFARVQERLRRQRERRKGGRRRYSIGEATADTSPVPSDTSLVDKVLEARKAEEAAAAEANDLETHGDVPVTIREKVFPAEHMSVDDAVDNMELVGHDFYLFVEAETQRPSAVYRRRGWSYGVISLADGDTQNIQDSAEAYERRYRAPVS